MFGLLALPGMVLRLLLVLCLWLLFRPGGWAVACCIGIALTWYL